MKLTEVQGDGLSEVTEVFNLVESGARGPSGLIGGPHNDTTGKQGGKTDEFYHITEDFYNALVQADINNTLNTNNAVASIKQLLLTNGGLSTSLSGGSSTHVPTTQRLVTFSDNSADDVHVLTLASNLSTALYDLYALRIKENYGDGKIVRLVLSNGVNINLYPGDCAFVQRKSGSEFVAIATHISGKWQTGAGETQYTAGTVSGVGQTITIDQANGNAQKIIVSTPDAFTIAKGTFQNAAVGVSVTIEPADGVAMGAITYSGFTKRDNHTFADVSTITAGGVGAAGGYAEIEIWDKADFDYIFLLEVA